MKGELVSSAPIRELRDTMLNPAAFAPYQQYLEKVCGCTCMALGDNSVVVCFPEGTMEEEYTGMSTPWRRETTIRLPNGVKLIKRMYPALREGEKTLVALVLPQSAIEQWCRQRKDLHNERWRGELS